MKGAFKGALIGALASTLVLASGAVAALAPGDPLKGGVVNTFDIRTNLTGNSANGMFRVINASTSTTTPTLWGVSNAVGAPAIRGTSNANGIGVHGTSGSGSGVFGASATGRGVWGDNASTVRSAGGDKPGVYGKANAEDGVQGVSTGGNGVAGKTAAGVASGVYGENTGSGGFGVAGRAGNLGHAVYGDNSGTGFAGYFEDKVHIGGALDCVGCVDAADVTGKVGDADKLDGLDSNAFGRTRGQAVAVPPGFNVSLGDPLGGFLTLFYSCSSDPPAGNGSLIIWNNSGSAANVFVDSGGANPQYTQMTAGQQLTYPAAFTGDSFHIDAQGAPGVMTIDVATVHRTDDCYAQALALLTS
jgi:hypothetical protein